MFLNQALIQFALHHGYSKGMVAVMTPFMMRQSVMAACAQLSQFDEELYKATGEPSLVAWLHVKSPHVGRMLFKMFGRQEAPLTCICAVWKSQECCERQRIYTVSVSPKTPLVFWVVFSTLAGWQGESRSRSGEAQSRSAAGQ